VFYVTALYESAFTYLLAKTLECLCKVLHYCALLPWGFYLHAKTALPWQIIQITSSANQPIRFRLHK